MNCVNEQARAFVMRLGYFGFVCWLAMMGTARCQEPTASDKAPAPTLVDGAGGSLKFSIPAGWTQKQPTVRIIEHEFAAPAADGDEAAGRLTMMQAGGSVKQNVDRWKGQFQTSGNAPQFKSEQVKVAGQTVHVIDITGTYLDRRGPFGPATPRDNYRMLGAIVESPERGLYFLKFYGPKDTIAKHADAFHAMVKGMKKP